MYKKLVVKIGASVLRSGDSLNLSKFNEIAQDTAILNKSGRKIILVSSGAIASGLSRLKIKRKPQSLCDLQAIASLGQIELMKLYQKYFAKYNIEIGQVLLNWDDFSNRKRYLNARDTMLNLLKLNIIPIVNENDVLATEEIKFGDNDRLSAMVASLAGADLLVILSDVEGIYDSEKKLILDVENLKDIKKYCFGTDKEFCVGGMITKIEAAKIATSFGIPTFISSGKIKNPISEALNKKIGTFIRPQKKLQAKKHWIAYLSKPKGAIIVDTGAEEAVSKKNRSILPKGVIGCSGHFDAGDLIDVLNCDNIEIARGISAYSSSEIEKIKGKNTSDITAILGRKKSDEIICRDNLVLTKDKK